MNIIKYLQAIRKKLFSTYEYDERFITLDERFVSLEKKLSTNKFQIDEIKSEIRDQKNHFEKIMQLVSNNLRLSNTISRCTDKQNARPCILFLINNLNAWYALDELIRSLYLQSEFDIVVASINKRFPGQDDYKGEEDVHLFLNDRDIKHIRLGMNDSYQALDIIMAISPDVIFRQSQWDPDYPPALSSENLNFTKLAIISYGICNIVTNTKYIDGIKDSATDSLFHRRCWRVYCASDYVKRNAINNGSLDARQFKVVGHPKIDYLLKVTPQWPFKHNNQYRVLWSPHHSISKGWSDFGMFHQIWKNMAALAKELDYIDFIFCPHPALVTQLTGPHPLIPKDDYNEFLLLWGNMQNCHQYYGADYAEISSASDLIVTDGISMLMECQLLNKEIIFLEREDHVPFNNIGKILSSGYHIVRDIDGLKDLILKYISGNLSSLIGNQNNNIEELFPKRGAVVNIIDDLREGLLNGK